MARWRVVVFSQHGASSPPIAQSRRSIVILNDARHSVRLWVSSCEEKFQDHPGSTVDEVGRDVRGMFKISVLKRALCSPADALCHLADQNREVQYAFARCSTELGRTLGTGQPAKVQMLALEADLLKQRLFKLQHTKSVSFQATPCYDTYHTRANRVVRLPLHQLSVQILSDCETACEVSVDAKSVTAATVCRTISCKAQVPSHMVRCHTLHFKWPPRHILYDAVFHQVTVIGYEQKEEPWPDAEETPCEDKTYAEEQEGVLWRGVPWSGHGLSMLQEHPVAMNDRTVVTSAREDQDCTCILRQYDTRLRREYALHVRGAALHELQAINHVKGNGKVWLVSTLTEQGINMDWVILGIDTDGKVLYRCGAPPRKTESETMAHRSCNALCASDTLIYILDSFSGIVHGCCADTGRYLGQVVVSPKLCSHYKPPGSTQLAVHSEFWMVARHGLLYVLNNAGRLTNHIYVWKHALPGASDSASDVDCKSESEGSDAARLLYTIPVLSCWEFTVDCKGSIYILTKTHPPKVVVYSVLSVLDTQTCVVCDEHDDDAL